MYYVYVLWAADGCPLYVGKGSGNRAWQHKEPKLLGTVPQVVLDQITEDAAFSAEMFLIAEFGRPPLLNIQDGGHYWGPVPRESRVKARRVDLLRVEGREAWIQLQRRTLAERSAKVSKALGGRVTGAALLGEHDPMWNVRVSSGMRRYHENLTPFEQAIRAIKCRNKQYRP
jgi:hypothetical protein